MGYVVVAKVGDLEPGEGKMVKAGEKLSKTRIMEE